MKYNSDKQSYKSSSVRMSDYNNQYNLNNRIIIKNQYNTQEISTKPGETSELIIEDNTVYEIDKECIACRNKKNKK